MRKEVLKYEWNSIRIFYTFLYSPAIMWNIGRYFHFYAAVSIRWHGKEKPALRFKRKKKWNNVKKIFFFLILNSMKKMLWNAFEWIIYSRLNHIKYTYQAVVGGWYFSIFFIRHPRIHLHTNKHSHKKRAAVNLYKGNKMWV